MRKAPFAHIFVLIAFLANSTGAVPLAQASDFVLPAPGVMVPLSSPLNPPVLKGLKVHPDNPFQFDFILDQGDGVPKDRLQQESTKLIKYFLASLTIPEKDLWVNLSPYEKNRIIPQSFGQTEMGRDLLAEDYMLKQITASLIYPEGDIGKKFWKRIYEEASKKYGTTNIPVNTFNKVWIVPEKAVVYENAKAGTAYVVESRLKVMLEQDYLALEKNTVILNEAKDHNKLKDSSASPQNDVSTLGSQIVRASPATSELLKKSRDSSLASNILRAIVIPELTKEVNEDENFAKLRQIYSSLILATWYKKKIKDSILSQIYSDKNKVIGVNIKDPKEKEKIYQQYLKAFKKGAYNYIKEEVDPLTQVVIPRKYFSGGMDLAITSSNYGLKAAFQTVKFIPKGILPDKAMVIESKLDQAMESESTRSVGRNQNLFDTEMLPGFKGWRLKKGTRFGSNWDWLRNKPYSEPEYLHEGADFFEYVDANNDIKAIPEGTKILSLTDGIVFLGKDDQDPLANETWVLTDDYKMIRYGHNIPLIPTGTRVKKGEPIAIFGYSSKYGMQAHLHLEVRILKFTVIPRPVPLRKQFKNEFDYENELNTWTKGLNTDTDLEDPLKIFSNLAVNLDSDQDQTIGAKAEKTGGDRAQLSRVVLLGASIASMVFSAVGCSSIHYSRPENLWRGQNIPIEHLEASNKMQLTSAGQTDSNIVTPQQMSVSRIGMYQPKMQALQQSIKDAIRLYEAKQKDWQSKIKSQGAVGYKGTPSNPRIDGPLYILDKLDKMMQTDSIGSLKEETGLYFLFDGIKQLVGIDEPVIRDVINKANALLGFSYLYPPSPDRPELIMMPGAGGEPMWKRQVEGILLRQSEHYNIIGYTFDPTRSLEELASTLEEDAINDHLNASENLIVALSYGNTVLHSAILRTIHTGHEGIFSKSYVLSLGFLPGGSASFLKPPPGLQWVPDGVASILKPPEWLPRVMSPLIRKYEPLIEAMDPRNPKQHDIAINIRAIQRATKGIYYIETKSDPYIAYKDNSKPYSENRDLILGSLDNKHLQYITPPSSKVLGIRETPHVTILFAPEVESKINGYLKGNIKKSPAMNAPKNTGGIDLTAAYMNLHTKNEGEGIKFKVDFAILQQLQNAPGFVPVIINIQPMRDLKGFLGIDEQGQAIKVS